MTEPKIRWRAKYDALSVELEQTTRELQDAVSNGLNLAKENDRLREEVTELKKAVERARLEGMHDVTGLLLHSDHHR
jgi:phage-related minor tail protein